MIQAHLIQPCPKCGSTVHIRQKMLLIDKFNEAHFRHQPNVRNSCRCQGDLSVDGLKPEFVDTPPLQQFVTGLYCEACSVGFVPDEMAKPQPPRWRLTAEGFHPVNPDGTLGPAQEHMG